jgi:putative transposase
MSNYRRNRVPGGSFFFTVNLQDRRSDLLVAGIDALRDAVRATRAKHPFHIDAWAVLPDHLHCLWTLPPGDSGFPLRWQMIKALFSRSVPHPADRRASLVRRREAGIWQRRYRERTIRDDADYSAHMDYLHFNPVKHDLAAHPADWPFSSFAGCVARGLYPSDWAGRGPDLNRNRRATTRPPRRPVGWASAHRRHRAVGESPPHTLRVAVGLRASSRARLNVRAGSLRLRRSRRR